MWYNEGPLSSIYRHTPDHTDYRQFYPIEAPCDKTLLALVKKLACVMKKHDLQALITPYLVPCFIIYYTMCLVVHEVILVLRLYRAEHYAADRLVS